MIHKRSAALERSVSQAWQFLKLFTPRHEIFYNVVCATSKTSDQPAHMRSLIL